MKILVSALSMFMVSSVLVAQEAEPIWNEKGNHLIGTGVKIDPFSTYTQFKLNPRYGYFVADKLLIGFESGVDISGNRYREVSMGPFVRYYFNQKRWSPFVEVNYSYASFSQYLRNGSDQIIDAITGNSHNIFAGGGINMTTKKGLGVELFVGYSGTSSETFSQSTGSRNNNFGEWKLGLRFTYQFRKKK